MTTTKLLPIFLLCMYVFLSFYIIHTLQSAILGSHSVALDNKGYFYSWGLPHASGHGAQQQQSNSGIQWQWCRGNRDTRGRRERGSSTNIQAAVAPVSLKLPIMTPTRLSLKSLLLSTTAEINVETNISSTSTATGMNNQQSVANNNTNISNDLFKVSDLACGACFTVAVLTSGRVCSWGVWDNGRSADRVLVSGRVVK